ncbi:hypothetical protein [Streptomyces sp. NBC_01233]|uniref:hypothetical protein n=1 Tax=Streptomyces sp. NBC_01233 TaxID=2903787 RepID=UPI002E0D0FE0|nr:hypothetical protein OG332_16100 [Streptomyces sp. NBC_01233]
MGNGMSRRRTGLIAALAVAVLAAGTIVFGVLRGGGTDQAGSDSFCWGLLTREDVAAFSSHPAERYTENTNQFEDPSLSYCGVGPAGGGTELSLDIKHVIGGDSIWRAADDIAAESPFRSPIAGVPGWVNATYAGRLLPASCARALGKGAWPYLQVHAGDRKNTAKDGVQQQKLVHVLATATTRLAAKLGCTAGQESTPPADAPKLLEPRPLDPAAACGLPGFAPLASTDKPFQEYVTPGDFRLWSCSFGPAGDVHGLRNVTVTQDPEVLAMTDEDTSAQYGEARLTCGGKPTLLQLGRTDEAPPGDGPLRTDAEILAGFRDAVARQAHCT